MFRTALCAALLAPLPVLAHGLHLEVQDGHSHLFGLVAIAAAALVGLGAGLIARRKRAA